MKLVGACVLIVGLMSAVPAPSEPVFTRAEGQQRDPAEYAKLLEGAERVEKLQVPRVVAALTLKPGMSVADIGSGSGLFTRPIAKAVAPGGRVYAVDIDEGLLALVASRAREARIENVVTVVGASDDPKLPEPVDVIFICDTLHHIENRPAYLRNLRQYLRPGGRVAIIDFSAVWPEGHESMRFSVQELDEWMRAGGYTREASHDWLDNSFYVLYR